MIFDFSTITENWPFLIQGLIYSFKVSFVTVIAGIFGGTLLALISISRNRVLKIVASIYINFFRSVPLIQILLAFYILFPFIIKLITGHFSPVDAKTSAYYSFSLFEAAYFSEIIRTGIQSIPKGQIMAARSLGMGYLNSMRYIILPQAYRAVFPVLTTQIFIIFQDVSLVYSIGAIDFFSAADQLAQRDFNLVAPYTFVAAVYFVICFTLSRIAERLTNKIT